MNATPVLALIVGLAWGANNGGSSSPTARTTTPAPCALLAPNEVSGALGATVWPPQPIATTGCSWVVDHPHLIVSLSLWPGSGFDQMKAPYPNATKSAVSGVGDDAVSATIGTYVTLSVKKGDVAFVVKVYGISDPAKAAAIEKNLALLVAGRV